jgi:hypothetical protein
LLIVNYKQLILLNNCFSRKPVPPAERKLHFRSEH